MAKRLIINADDYGLTRGVSQGILDAHLKGIVTSTTAMMGSPGIEDTLPQAIQSAPALGIGLHLTISGEGRPVLPPDQVPSLVRENGRFFPFEESVQRYDQFSTEDLRRELYAQFERFMRIAGRLPDHLDGHHHAVYRHERAYAIVLEMARANNLPVRKANVRSDTPSGVPAPDQFIDTYYDATAPLGDLLLILTGLPDGVTTELMCHPGYSDAMLDSDYTTGRDAEVRALTHLSAREVVKAEGIELITFAALG